MVVGIHKDLSGKIDPFLKIYIKILEYNQINYKILDIESELFWNEIKNIDIFIFRYGHHDARKQKAKIILPLIENFYKKKCFPDFNTSWHFDDKIRQYYIMKANNFPIIESWIFFEKANAKKWLENAEFPIVFKLRSGAGSHNIILIHNKKQAIRLINRMFDKGIISGQVFNFNSVKIKDFNFLKTVKYLLKKTYGKIKSDYTPFNWQIERSYVFFQKYLPNNDFDTRVTIINDRAFAFRRFNRKNDFRSSGSGNINYDMDKISLECVKIAFIISKKMNFKSMAYDFLTDENGQCKFCEISYTYQDLAVFNCPGFWDNDLNWHKGHFWPQFCILSDLLSNPNIKQPKIKIKPHKEKSFIYNKMDRFKILHVISSLARGGRERQLSTIYKYTKKDIYPTKIIYFNIFKDNYINEFKMEQDLIHIKSNSFIKRLIEIQKTINSFKPDIVYTWGNLESLFILILSKFNKFKFINGSIRHGIRLKKKSHFYRMIILHLSPNIVANSKAGLKANNIKHGYVLYNGIDERFDLECDETEKKRKQKSILGRIFDFPVICSVANLVPYKDYYTVLNVLKVIKEKGFQFFYIIIGDGPLKKDIETKIKKYQLENNVIIVGGISNVEDYLSISDIFIHSSKGEGCSNAILEAMYMRLPIIATNTGGTSEIVDKKNSLLFEYGDLNMLNKHLTNLLTDKKLINKMSKASYRIVKEKFTIDKMIGNYESYINHLLNNKIK